MPNPQDAELMQMFETVGRRGFAYAWQMLHNHDDALDAVQSALAAVWQGRKRLDPRRDARGWFYRVLRNKCIDTIRLRRSRSSTTLDSDLADHGAANPTSEASRREDVAAVRAALAELPDEMREIVLLRDFHDLSYADISKVLEIPAGTVMSRLHRARMALRERLLTKELPDG